ncbi:hypothetical protein BJ166DRAFT_530008 [Pestalotiopsis sp. NC0098]|nr:hypothetical protein BJ166DRAFT_530008 [Pestalotiopsis sp. NC0098]
MGFLTLPTEVLRQVLQQSEPDDFESALLTCKRVHAAGRVFVTDHNNYKRIFRNIQFKAEWGDDIELCRALVELLRIIAASPRGAAHVRVLTIHDYLHDMPCKDGTGLRLGGSERSTTELELSSLTSVADMILDSPWLQAAGCDSTAWVALVTAVRDANESRGDSQEAHDVRRRQQQEAARAVFPLFVLLLTQLTHLESLHVKYDLHIPSSCNEDEGSPVLSQARKVLDIMAICVGKGNSPSIDKVLSKVPGLPPSPIERLTELNYCPPAGFYQATDLIALNPFMASPKLGQLRATNLRAASNLGFVYTWPASRYGTAIGTDSPSSVQGGASQSPFADAMPLLLASREYSAIEHLELVSCCIDPQGMARLLERLPSLTTIRYTHHAKAGPTEDHFTAGYDFDAGWFLKAIAHPRCVGCGVDKHLRDTCQQNDQSDDRETSRDSRSANLEDPDLASRITDLSVGFESLLGHIVTGVTGTTMKHFTSLKRLVLDVRIFLGPDPYSGERREVRTNWDPAESSWNPDESSWDPESDIPCLIDVLPRTLESLELFLEMQDTTWYHFDMEHWTRLLMGFREGREERLPNLRDFVVRENPLMSRVTGIGPSGAYQQVVDHENMKMVRNRQAVLEAGADLISADEIQMSWRQELDETEAIIYAGGHR